MPKNRLLKSDILLGINPSNNILAQMVHQSICKSPNFPFQYDIPLLLADFEFAKFVRIF